MHVTKLGHSCVAIRKDSTVAVIDPGIFTSVEAVAALDAVDALFVTHKHSDHITKEHLEALTTKHPNVVVYANAETAAMLQAWGTKTVVIEDGETVTHGSLSAIAYEVNHHEIHAEVPVVRNTALLFNQMFLHPGDALFVPEDPVPAVAVPFAPFVSLDDIITYCITLKPETILSVHDGYFAKPGPYESVPKAVWKNHDLPFSWWHDGESIEL